MLIWWSSTFFMGFFHHSEIQYWLKFRKSYSQKPNVWWNYYMVEMSLCDFFLWNPKWLLSQLEKLFFSPTTEPFERNHVLDGALSVFILSNNIAIYGKWPQKIRIFLRNWKNLIEPKLYVNYHWNLSLIKFLILYGFVIQDGHHHRTNLISKYILRLILQIYMETIWQQTCMESSLDG